MKLCLMILSVPWYMFNGLEHTVILSYFLAFITEVVPDYCASLQSRIPPVGNPVLVSGCVISSGRNFIHQCSGSGIKILLFLPQLGLRPILSVCTRGTCLVGFLQCKLSETIVRGQTCHSAWTHYPDSEPISLCSFFLMLHGEQRSNKCQFYSLWFESSWA